MKRVEAFESAPGAACPVKRQRLEEDAATERLLVVDFGSQVSHLICRRVREANVFCELRSCLVTAEELRAYAPKGIILSGSPHSVYDTAAPHFGKEMWDVIEQLKLPVLAICYGLQEMCSALGGQVEAGKHREFGRADLHIRADSCSALFDGMESDGPLPVWMSHGDKVVRLPDGFEPIASTSNTEFAAVCCRQRQLYGVQFHPEMTHTPSGARMISNFAHGVCGLGSSWTMQSFCTAHMHQMVDQLEDKYVIGAVSGGVDSSVAAALVHRAIGNRFRPFLVDNGLLRHKEAEKVKERLEKHIPGLKLTVIDAKQDFYSALAGVRDPEKKRKIIGGQFVEAFVRASKEMGLEPGRCLLLQGTAYPDVIESTSFKGPSSVIKTHHNVGGLPEKMEMEVIEPLRLLFKDEIRQLGRELGLPHETVMRHPFPGPGLGIRIIGEVTEPSVEMARAADHIFIEELRREGHYDHIGQAFCVLMPDCKTVGVMGDQRTYECTVALRAVRSTDFMTASAYHLPWELVEKVCNRIINEVHGINRVVLDPTSKPPATIEWE